MERLQNTVLLTVGSDRKLFEKNSNVLARTIEYSALVKEIHIIVFSTRAHGLGSAPRKVHPNIWLYPTNSLNKWFYISDAIALGKKIKKNDDEKLLITTQDPSESGIAGLKLAQHHQASLQVQVHGDMLSNFFQKESVLNKVRLILANKVIPKADCVRVVSKRAKNSLMEKYNLKKEPILLPIYTDTESLHKKNKTINLRNKYKEFDFIVLMASRLEQVKGVDTALYAFGEVARNHKNIGLVILGDGSLRKSLEALAKKLGIEKNVKFEGWQEGVLGYMSEADLFLNTSRHEGYCLSLIEAASLGTPILTTDVGVVGDVINEENALICDVDDKTCLQSHILEALDGEIDIATLGAKAKREISKKTLKKADFLVTYRNSLEKCLL